MCICEHFDEPATNCAAAPGQVSLGDDALGVTVVALCTGVTSGARAVKGFRDAMEAWSRVPDVRELVLLNWGCRADLAMMAKGLQAQGVFQQASMLAPKRALPITVLHVDAAGSWESRRNGKLTDEDGWRAATLVLGLQTAGHEIVFVTSECGGSVAVSLQSKSQALAAATALVPSGIRLEVAEGPEGSEGRISGNLTERRVDAPVDPTRAPRQPYLGELSGLISHEQLAAAIRSDPTKHLIVDVRNGLGNRLRAIASAKHLALAHNRSLTVIWQVDEAMGAPVEALLAPGGAHHILIVNVIGCHSTQRTTRVRNACR